MTTRIPHFIDGKRTELASTRTADVMNIFAPLTM